MVDRRLVRRGLYGLAVGTLAVAGLVGCEQESEPVEEVEEGFEEAGEETEEAAEEVGEETEEAFER